MKSTREPKERKKKETKPRKSSAKSKSVLAESTDTLVEETSQTATFNTTGESTNGTVAPHGVIVETVLVEIDPPYEEIAARAYQLFVERGYEHGRHIDDWLAAERELKSKYRSA